MIQAPILGSKSTISDGDDEYGHDQELHKHQAGSNLPERRNTLSGMGSRSVEFEIGFV